MLVDWDKWLETFETHLRFYAIDYFLVTHQKNELIGLEFSVNRVINNRYVTNNVKIDYVDNIDPIILAQAIHQEFKNYEKST